MRNAMVGLQVVILISLLCVLGHGCKTVPPTVISAITNAVTTTTGTTTTTTIPLVVTPPVVVPPVVQPSGDYPAIVNFGGGSCKWEDLKQACTLGACSLDARGWATQCVYDDPTAWGHPGAAAGSVEMTWKHDGQWVAHYWSQKAPQANYTYVDLKASCGNAGSPITPICPAYGDKVGMFFVLGNMRSDIAWYDFPLDFGTHETTAPDNSGNVPSFDPANIPSNWSTDSSRVYDGRLALSNEFHGSVETADSTNVRYRLREHFEHDMYVQTGYATKGQVNIVAGDGVLTWSVVQ